MARTIAPGTPTPVEPVDVKIPDIDLTLFDQYGDYKIKSATQNFQLYATTTANAEAQKAYQRFKTNPIALANALSKLPKMFSDLPQSIQDDLKPKLDNNAISLVTKAQANQQAAINKQNKALAQANAVLNMNQLSDDYFNVLRYITSPDEEKRPIDMAIYKQHRSELERLTNITDEDGKPLFSETQRTKMLMPKDATVAGFKQFVNRMESDQLKEWDEKIFQNQTKFMEDTNIDPDTYESMETYLIKRKQALDDDKVRKLHGQAYYDATNLITEPTQLNIEKAKGYDFTDDKAIDKLAEVAKETTHAKYYAPDQPTSPTAFLQAYTIYGDLLKNIPDDLNVQQQQEMIAAFTRANERLLDISKATNLGPEETNKIQLAMKKALTDKVAKKALTDINFGSRVKEFMDTIDPAVLQGYAVTRNITTARENANMIQRQEDILKKKYTNASKEWLDLAIRQYNIDMANAIDTFLMGDMETFKQQVALADRKFDKTRASFIVPDEFQWQRLENALADGKPALIQYGGRMLEFKGFDNRGALFQERN